MRRPGGFTFIELLAVLAIVGLLVAAAQPLQALVARRAQEQALREALRSLRGALDAHQDAVLARRIAPGPNGSPWPADLSVLVQGAVMLDEQGQPRADRARLQLLRRLPRDPFAPREWPAEQTWAIRSSQSPPGVFEGGADVFDVASRSERAALDGTLYRDW